MQPLKPLYKKLDKCVRLLEELNAQVRDLRRKTSAIAEERSFNTGQNEPDSVKENYVKPGETKCDALAAMLDEISGVCDNCGEDCSECGGYSDILESLSRERDSVEGCLKQEEDCEDGTETIVLKAAGASEDDRDTQKPEPEEASEYTDTDDTEQEPAKQRTIARGYNIDKYGRVYTEEEIQKIIID